MKKAATDGFVRLPNWLLDDSSLTLHELMVYTVLLRFRDHKTGKCFPGMSTIADRARISRKSVERAISKLEARGMIRVQRRSTLTENKPNVYEVSTANETPDFVWADTARGKRIPQRLKATDSESAGVRMTPSPTDSESLPTDSESVPPQTPSRPNKIQENKNQEQTLRSVLPNAHDSQFTFDVDQQKATSKQRALLHDLWIHVTGDLPDARLKGGWANLTTSEAQDCISKYYASCGRYDEYTGPDYGTAAYQALSQRGRMWADAAMIPDNYMETAA
ncbi:helix-turn-helix domain-containing protein (plasmid) [Coraliomargarita sp. W4R53]